MIINNISLSHDEIKRIKQLKKKPILGENLIEDLSILEFLKDENKKLDLFIFCPEIINKENTIKIKDYFINNSTKCYSVSKKTYLSIVEKENNAGLIGIYKEKILTINDIDLNKHKFIVVADKLENPGNLGTLFRTCDGCKVDLIIIVDEIVKHNSFKVIQASRGMSIFVDKVVLSYQQANKFLLDNNYDIYLGEPILGKDYKYYDYKNNIAIVVGNERFGINSDWYNHNHKKVYIPMVGKMTSLNVSVAASILIYEAFMKRNNF